MTVVPPWVAKNVTAIDKAAPPAVPGSPMDYALRYAAIGWLVFPVWGGLDGKCRCGRCGDDAKSPGKHPVEHLARGGVNSATTNPDQIRAWWTQFPEAGIGVSMSGSGLVAIDIDPRNGGLDTIDQIEAQHGALESDVLAFTQGGGEHRVFSLASDAGLPGKLGKGIDIKRNGYIVVEPTQGVQGKYAWEASSDPLDGAVPSPLPDWLRGLAQSREPIASEPVRFATREQLEELRSALAVLEADDRDTWIRYLHALKPLGQDGFDLWDEWSRKSAKYDPVDAIAKWHSAKPAGAINYETIFFAAQAAGWVNPLAGGSTLGANVSALLTQAPEQRSATPMPAPQGPYVFPDHLLEVPGLVGDVAHYINASSLFPQPVLALGAALTFCGALFGRKVASDTDLRTNIYVIGVGDSGSGKEHARKALKKLAVAAGAEKIIGAEKLASDQGLFGLLSQNPSCVVLMDEFGRALRTLGNDRAPAHLQQLMTMLLELTGAADSYIMEKRRAEHADPDRRPMLIQNPNLCIYATTVPGRLFQGLTPDEIVDGFLPRWLILESDTPDPVLSRSRSQGLPLDLVETVSAWAERTPEMDTSNLANPVLRPQVLGTDAGADTVLDRHITAWAARKREARGTGLDALWARGYEHALRLCLIRAAGRGGASINEADATWACELTEFLLSRTATQATANVAANEYEAQTQKVAAFLEAKGEVTLSTLTRKFRWLKQRARDEILGSLMDAQQVAIAASQTEGRSSRKIVWIGKEGKKG